MHRISVRITGGGWLRRELYEDRRQPHARVGDHVRVGVAEWEPAERGRHTAVLMDPQRTADSARPCPLLLKSYDASSRALLMKL